jgi:LacI family transcriptional regulator/LacI family purine nucleotide synthesis repressor
MKKSHHCPTLNDVAEKAEVSRQTVSRYINGGGAVAARTSERIRTVIEMLQYHPSAAARSLRKKRTMTVGLALYSAQDLSMEQSELFALKLSGVLEVLGPRGYGLQVVETNPSAAHSGRGTHYLDRIRGGEIDGVIISDFHLPIEDIRVLRESGAPFVMIDRFIPEFPGRCAMTDVYLEGFRLTNALLARGHRKLAYCGWPPHRGLAHRFRDGMAQALTEVGDGAEIVIEVFPAKDGTYGTLDRLSRALGAEHAPTGAVCNDDWMTGMVALLAQRGVPSADNFQLAGVSLRPDYLDAAHVALVATPMDRQLGIAGAELLLDIINGKPERSEPVNVGAARFVSPSFPYLVHPKNTGSGVVCAAARTRNRRPQKRP